MRFERIHLAAMWAAALAGGPAWGVEKAFDLSATRAGDLPPGFRSAVAGAGAPGDWKVVEVPLHSQLPQGVSESGGSPRQAVLAQMARDSTDEHFPLLIYEPETFADFTLSAKVRTVDGGTEQMAGLAFRIRDEKNFYVLRVSSLGGNVRFYKNVDGVRSMPLGIDLPIPRGTWHELKVACTGNQIRCWLNDRELFPPLTDSSFTEGRIGLWTKSDSVSQFTDVKVVYRPHEPLAQRLVRQGMEEFGRLVALKIAAAAPGSEEVKVIASSDPEDVGKPAPESEQRASHEGAIFHGRDGGVANVVMPLRDRNGDPAAAVRVVMKSFPGQTRDNALVRARPVVEWMERRFKSGRDLFE